MSIDRQPAIRRPHPAANLPSRDEAVEHKSAGPAAPATASSATATGTDPLSMGSPSTSTNEEEKFNEQHNVRIRPSTRRRVLRAVDRLRYETGDRTLSIALATDQALIEWCEHRGC
ncbi:hypothetical protein P0W64_21140 [Tsukamurella sp. 8F]|uniref:hypothetical protein n=1 Tax=unclassified Tsukamurella TaxID=2633480 RepID=UPI0023B9D6C2|nr:MULTISPECIES: hypothetical protein [unclassified Tsukamurella]MDF0532263.1 hypothetical protein [Tsukamurella sp. 8J]MDF0589289.1 hypothetical protein [Tsukamurella sp. 8F]